MLAHESLYGLLQSFNFSCVLKIQDDHSCRSKCIIEPC